MKPVILAKSKPRMANSFNGIFWFEYQLSDFDQDDFLLLKQDGSLHSSVFYHRYRIDQRRVDLPVGGVETPHKWTLWTYADSPRTAIKDVIGDSNFISADSHYKLHADIVAETLAARKASRIEQRRKEDLTSLKNERDDLLRKVNAAHRLAIDKYSDDPGKLAKAEVRLKKRWQLAIDVVNYRIKSLGPSN